MVIIIKVDEKGVLPDSDYYFPSSGSLTKSLFFYPVCIGDFICNESYSVKRKSYNSFLLMYIKSGSGRVAFNDKTYNVSEGSIVFLDCYRHHEYGTSKGWKTLWLHFDGSNSRAYYDFIYNKIGCVIPLYGKNVIPNILTAMLNGYRSEAPVPEPLICCHIQQMLSELIISTADGNFSARVENSPVSEAIGYIELNYSKKISLAQITNRVNLSPFYFSRQFKKETGYSPYEYIIKIRLENAKSMLKNSNLHIKEIAYNCGFSSESNFVYCFHRNVGISPKEFRNTPF